MFYSQILFTYLTVVTVVLGILVVTVRALKFEYPRRKDFHIGQAGLLGP